ncbi:hypothetical protein [Streptomyces caniscabiei]|uniref:Uncharacterized protein n=1 Tax=Streptomyces caniscabiei TaxID=2746961 RepID=A0A927QI37_9ACTN|nr:hypothetical protein [Streptomyces caniscabiei]MBD9703941.1 hypothetical protein [Streptomyces caniscabiei]MBD9727948.1 hypothetical protein [Streptomyces caniscabiei]MDX3513375.1 hypothetical protein [Streptomyces caniscabiei]MDX3722491.1 hypothetical protein [Streptomyces caniscabiei]MDX3732367.1 hypothetical protein [Streptomyces caniscabiei]
MTDPLTLLWQARRGPVPADWRVFTKRRGKLSGFFHGTSDDPDPLLVITPDCAVEYISERKPLKIVVFQDVAEMKLRVASSDSSAAVSTWVDLRYLDGNKAKWRSAGFDLEAIQGFIEAYGVHKAYHGYA